MASRFHPYRRSPSSPSPLSSPQQSPTKSEYGLKVSSPSSHPEWNAFIGLFGGQGTAREAAEPDWLDAEAARAWLERRYRPGNTTLGSPLFQYMTRKLRKSRSIPWGSDKTMQTGQLAKMLSNRELDRWVKENPKASIMRSAKRERLYPDPPLSHNLSWSDPSCSFVDLDTAGLIMEPGWGNAAASRTWLEQRYPLNHTSSESPLYRYMKECYSGLKPLRSTPATWLGMMLSWDELMKWDSTHSDLANELTLIHDKETEPLYPSYPANEHQKENQISLAQEETENTILPQLRWADRSCSFQDLDMAGLIVEQWADDATTKAWLEERYCPGDPSLGSPLYQYMIECYSGWRPRKSTQAKWLVSLLARSEFQRWMGSERSPEHDKASFVYENGTESLYPDPRMSKLSWSNQSCSVEDLDDAGMMREPDWKDINMSKAWLEERYRWDPALGSPLYQYMKECKGGIRPMKKAPAYLCSMLSVPEVDRWTRENGHAAAIDNPRKLVLYPSPVANDLFEAVPVKKTKRNRKPMPKRTQAEKLQDQEAISKTLRSGIAKRTHRKPELVYLEFNGRIAVQAKQAKVGVSG